MTLLNQFEVLLLDFLFGVGMGADSSSPDDGDALALTFAMPVLPKKKSTASSSKRSYSPWS